MKAFTEQFQSPKHTVQRDDKKSRWNTQCDMQGAQLQIMSSPWASNYYPYRLDVNLDLQVVVPISNQTRSSHSRITIFGV